MQVEILTPTLLEPTGLPRSVGVHVSNVIRVIGVQNGSLKPEYVESLDLVDREAEGWWESLDETVKIRMSIGMAWEQWYVQTQLPHVVHQPGEMELEGLYMTHDGEALETIITERKQQMVIALHEVKTTSKSLNTVGQEPETAMKTQYLWLAQTKAYCKGLGALLAYVHVLFLCGDYSYPIKQQVRVYRITFTQAEIDDNWEVLTTYVRHYQQQKAEDLMRDTE